MTSEPSRLHPIYTTKSLTEREKDNRICGCALSLSVIEYQTAILRGDTEIA